MAKTPPGPAPAAKPAPPPLAGPAPAAWVRPVVLAVVVLAGLAGVAERLWLTSIAPRWAYLTDHIDNIQMGRAAGGVQDPAVAWELRALVDARHVFTEQEFQRYRGKGVTHQFNLFRVYNLPAERLPAVWGDDYAWGKRSQPALFPRVAIRQVNYPPLGIALFWAESSLLEAVAPGQPVNTFTSRLVMSLASLLAELAAAFAAFLIVRRLVGTSAGLLAAAACWVLPPMAMDSFFWGQTDAWFIAPALFTIWLMMRGQWIGAGILSAVALLLKPQGIFLGPIVLMAAVLLPVEGPGPSGPAILKRITLAAGAGLAGFFVLGLPWTVAGGTEWIQLAYLKNIGLYNETTMKAFNIWYLDALLHDADASMVLHTKERLLGVAKSSWGNLLVAAALVALAVLYIRKFPKRNGPLAVVLFSGVWLWSTFLWPTGVHERYILYAIPLTVIAAFAMKRLWPAAIAITVIGAFELCHTVWLPVQAGKLVDPLMLGRAQEFLAAQGQANPGRFPPPTIEGAKRFLAQNAAQSREEYLRVRSGTRGLEWLLTLGGLLAYGWAFAAPFLRLGSAPPTGKPPTTDKPHPGNKAPSGAKRK